MADLMLGTQPCPTVAEYRRNMADLVTRGVQNLTQMQNVRGIIVHSVCSTVSGTPLIQIPMGKKNHCVLFSEVSLFQGG